MYHRDNTGKSSVRWHRDQKGQMAILIALIFQVLFVFFAMTVNVGMLVHQKINLQNSVDLAAFYAAQRQAEILNAMAHTNYQIRQAWKLMAWRLRAVGDLGRKYYFPGETISTGTGESHPAFFMATPDLPESSRAGAPIVCAAFGRWSDNLTNRNGENLCWDHRFSVPAIPVPNIGPVSFLSFVGPLLDFTRQMQEVQKKDCRTAGPANFALSARWLLSYRQAVRRRKATLALLANNLSGRPPAGAQVQGGSGDFMDISGNSTRRGALATFERNLTRPNKSGFRSNGGADKFEVYNSLSHPAAAIATQSSNGEPGFPIWVHDMVVWPILAYTDFIERSGGCIADSKLLAGAGAKPRHYDDRYSPQGPTIGLNYDLQGQLLANINEASNTMDRSSLGIEKNPWFMAYVGVKATVKVRQPFAPFGEPVTLTARAFAKPFGGTMGPWLHTRWQPTENTSDSSAERIDRLLPSTPPVDDPNQGVFTSSSYPNYSRFPGDTLGLRSRKAVASLRLALGRDNLLLNGSFWNNQPAFAQEADPVDRADYLAWNPFGRNTAEREPWIRNYEIAAVAPDLFDASYYSIEPDFDRAYRLKNPSNPFRLRRDFGFRPDQPNNGFGIYDQMEVAGQNGSQFLGENGSPRNAFHILRSSGDGGWARVLTGWIPNGAFEYMDPGKPETFPVGSSQNPRFARCAQRTKGEMPSSGVPGSCKQGGRTGYSVKIVAREYLQSSSLQLGGAGTAGPIRNPPPPEF